MNCITDETLRRKIDGELSQGESLAVDEHLAQCADCQRRMETRAAQVERVHSLLSVLSPRGSEAQSPPQFALARFNARRPAPALERRRTWSGFFLRRPTPAWGVALVTVLVVGGLLTFVTPQALADKLLELFRVNKITVVSVDSNLVRNGEDGPWGRQISQLLSDQVVAVHEPGKPQRVAQADEASALAGLNVRLPSGRSDTPKLLVEDESAFQIKVNRARLQSILDEAGHGDLQLPPSLDGANISVHIPKAVVAVYGDCPEIGPHMAARKPSDWAGCVALAQIRTPTVIAPADLNIPSIAEVGLQLTGMTPDEAHAFSQTVDWRSTLVIPIPREAASLQEVDVDGVTGTLIIQKAVEDRPQGYTLLWVKNGVIYSLTGFGDPAQAAPLADSLR